MAALQFPFVWIYISLLFHMIRTEQQKLQNNETRTTTVGYGGMVGSAHYLATEAGLQILRNGGNAADAAVAIQMALNVVQPMMSGIGGGCFILYYDYNNKSVYAIDGREEAPNNYHRKIFCKNPDCLSNPLCDCFFANQTANYNEKRIGGLSVGVPGTLYAFYNLHTYFGTTSDGNKWSDLLEPAKDLSLNGFQMYKEMHSSLSSSSSCMRRFPDAYNLYYNSETDEPVDINDTFTNIPFANLLTVLQEKGADDSMQYFYNGELAEMIVNATNSHFNVWQYGNETVNRPGVMRIDDINGYKSVFREVIKSDFGDSADAEYTMYGMNMPSSGSASVQYLMNLMYALLNKAELSHLNGTDILTQNISFADNIHYILTANNIAFSDRNQYMADPDFVDVPVHGLLDFDYIYNERANLFDAHMVETPIPFGIPPDVNTQPQTSMVGVEHGTSHFFVVDQWNNIATVTTTIEGGWGSCIVVPEYGFLLNNELTDFDALGVTFDNKTVPNGPDGGKKQRRTALDIFGLHDSETEGGKRPRSSMSPSLILHKHSKEPILSVGSPGGSTIISTTFETMFNILLRRWDVQKGIDEGRIWSFNNEDFRVEEKIWKENVNLRQELQVKGYDLSKFSNSSHGTCQAVQFVKTHHCKGKPDFYVLNGGADDLRWSAANVKPVCMGNGKSLIDVSSDFCIEHSNVCISTLTDAERISLITVWLICLITVLCIVVNRDRIRKWREKKKNKKMGYFADKDRFPTNENYA